jgi:hypothetical protein
MSAQGIIVAMLVIVATAYVFRTLAPVRWRRKLGLGPRGGGTDAATKDGGCGCSSCPPLTTRVSAAAAPDDDSR